MPGISGKTLVAWGVPPGSHMGSALALANRMSAEGADRQAILAAVLTLVPQAIPMRTVAAPYAVALDAETELERENAAAVLEHMDHLMRVPTISAGAVMPDACPSGHAPGTIPVGGVVACRDAIHPGFHSADICCSVAITVLRDEIDLASLLDAVQAVTHFGPGGRANPPPLPTPVAARITANAFTSDLISRAIGDFSSQGDGNHFTFVGRLRSTGQPAIVTHHGSRGFGAALYKKGMQAAQRHTAKVAPAVPKHNAWLKANSAAGQAYWDALQIVREWTRANHIVIHDQAIARVAARIDRRFWNEHNFVFQRADGLFYHGKGATPSFKGFSADDVGLTLIPLNMAEPVLVTAHRDNPDTLGFAPHGAGRNQSRAAYLRENRPEIPEGLDVRFFCGQPDLSELPGAYKNARAVREQIGRYGLAEVVDHVDPFGCIMAGDWERDAPWRNKGRSRAATATAA